MDDELELISDGESVAVIGDPKAVERFVTDAGLASKDLDLPKLSRVLGTGASAAQIGADLAAKSGRWVKLTPQSAADVKKYGFMPSKTPGVSHAMIGKPGNVKSWIGVQNGAGAMATNPVMLSGAAGIMTQLAMQQAMSEITAYLDKIDSKLDDVLRSQSDAVVSNMIGVGFDVDEAMTLREHTGRVNEVSWSKVQQSSSTIARTQSYALLQLDGLAKKVEDPTRVGELMHAAKEVEARTQDWLGVLARCFQLQEAIGVLELDRVQEIAPDDLDNHRLGLKHARERRLESIAQTTNGVLARMTAAATSANSRVLFNPSQSPSIVKSNAQVAEQIHDFHAHLGIEGEHEGLDARRWSEAATQVRDRARDKGVDGLGAAKRFGGKAGNRAKSLGSTISERARRNRDHESDDSEN